MDILAQTLELPRSIVLVGLMGAGKTCIGRRLAQRHGLAFRDADAEVERAADRTIPEIFETYGEAAFRDCERKVIGRLLGEAPHVLATGGGAFMNDETRALIKARGISVWLRADLELLVRRTAKRGNRPLLKGGDPRAILSDLMSQRDPIYAEADLVVDSRDGPPEQTVDSVETAVCRYIVEHQPAPVTGDADLARGGTATGMDVPS
jgi:shikimate kinase